MAEWVRPGGTSVWSIDFKPQRGTAGYDSCVTYENYIVYFYIAFIVFGFSMICIFFAIKVFESWKKFNHSDKEGVIWSASHQTGRQSRSLWVFVIGPNKYEFVMHICTYLSMWQSMKSLPFSPQMVNSSGRGPPYTYSLSTADTTDPRA